MKVREFPVSRNLGKEIRMKYLAIIEKGPSSYGVHVPDLPGCAAVAETREEVLRLIKEAIEFHIEELRASGQPIPLPSSVSEIIDVDAA